MWIATSILLATLVVPSLVHPASAAATQSSTSLIVPLYGYPSATWTTLAQQKLANPSVPIVAIINPSNGPGTAQDPNFVSGIHTLDSAGITVIGYTFTNYASTPLASVESAILGYKTLYGLSGVYLDQMSNVPGHESYYSTLTQYADSIGMSLVIGNPGADVPSSYIGTVNAMIIYESPGLPSLSFLGGWHTAYSKSNFGIVAYGVSSISPSYIASASNDVGYIYVTDGTMPNPYANLPSYLSSLLADLATSSAASSSSSVTVSAVDQDGTTLSGYYTTLSQGGSQVGTGFTPATFPTTAGQTYAVKVSNYGSCSFTSWQDTGSTSSLRTFTAASSALAYTAVYDCTNLAPVGGSGTSTIAVSTVNSAGASISGYYISLWQNGAQLNSCFSECSFTVSSGQTYQVVASGYGGEAFSQWLGGTSGALTVTTPAAGGTVSLTAVFSP
jgi:Spherulation-specific family 4